MFINKIDLFFFNLFICLKINNELDDEMLKFFVKIDIVFFKVIRDRLGMDNLINVYFKKGKEGLKSEMIV